MGLGRRVSSAESALLRARLANQGLATAPHGTVADVVRHLGAVQSQELAAAKWSLGTRTAGATLADVDAALASGEVVRTHVLRPTWHFVHARDLRWMLACTSRRVIAVLSGWDRRMGLDARSFARSERVIAKALQGGAHLTRTELGAALASEGLVVASGNRLAHYVMHAELDGVICSGPPRGKQQTYALVDERLPAGDTYAGDAALAELARRYFTSHGPASLKDFRWWSSLAAADAARAVALCGDALEETACAGVRLWGPRAAPAAPPRAPRGHLLQGYDEYLVAYADTKVFYGGYLPPQLRRDGSTGTHAAVVDGRLVAHSRWTDARAALRVELQPRRPLADAERKAIAQAAARMGRFLGRSVEITT